MTGAESVLDEPPPKTNRAVPFVTTISGRALGEKYSQFAELATASGYTLHEILFLAIESRFKHRPTCERFHTA